MATPIFTKTEVQEINSVIAEIEKSMTAAKKTKYEIGARDKVTLSALLKANNVESKSLTFFNCKRNHAEAILSHFIKTKGIKKNRFSTNAQSFIYLIA